MRPRTRIPGWIKGSYLVSDENCQILYTASNGEPVDQHESYLTSIALNKDGTIEMLDRLRMEVAVKAIAASTDYFVLAQVDDLAKPYGKTSLEIVDISVPGGLMAAGESIHLAGHVNGGANISIAGTSLRVVSEYDWYEQTNTNYLQIFDISDVHNAVAISHDTFGNTERITGTLFLEDRGFVNTLSFSTSSDGMGREERYFYTFKIVDADNVTQNARLPISNSDVAYHPVFGSTRLIGIGTKDRISNYEYKIVVNLYDVADLETPKLLDNQEITLVDANRFSPTGFTVLEEAVLLEAEDGTQETGLMFVPFEGQEMIDDGRHGNMVYGVQIFSFSPSTITPRGTMLQNNTSVNSTIDLHESTKATLTHRDLTLVDISDSDTPETLGRLELAPIYEDFLVFGEFGARLKTLGIQEIPSESTEPTPNALLQIVSLSENPDNGTPLGSVQIISDGFITQFGDHHVLTTHGTLLQVVDLSIPTTPRWSPHSISGSATSI